MTLFSAVLISVCEPLNHIHQDTKSARLIAVCKRSIALNKFGKRARGSCVHVFLVVIIMERRLRMTNAERSRLHRSRNRFCRTRLKQVMDALYSHFPDAWLFVHELQPPEFPVRSPPPRANARQQPGIRPEPQPRPQPALQREIRSEPQPRPQPALQPEIRSEPQPRPQPALQPEIRSEPQPRPQPALQPEPPCIDELMDELFGSASPHPCEGELDFELDFFLTIYNIKCK